MPRWVSKIVYYVTFKTWDGSIDYWVIVNLKHGWCLGIRDLRRTILKDSYAVRDRKVPGYIEDLKFRGRLWL